MLLVYTLQPTCCGSGDFALVTGSSAPLPALYDIKQVL